MTTDIEETKSPPSRKGSKNVIRGHKSKSPSQRQLISMNPGLQIKLVPIAEAMIEESPLKGRESAGR